VEKNAYLVNGTSALQVDHSVRFETKKADCPIGESPGPTIEARSGDRIVVHAHNGLVGEGFSIHWHGLEMRGSNATDGTVGFTQCPIWPGHEFIYNFTMGDDEHGTFWWHSHFEAQRGDGLYGGLMVHRPQPSALPSEEEALLLVSDWIHRSQNDILAEFHSLASQGAEPTPDSMLVNGYGEYNCSMADIYKPVVCAQRLIGARLPLLKEKSKTKLRLVNASTIAGITVRAEGATLQALAVDGGCQIDTQPRNSVGILYPGQRVDLLLDWKSSTPAMALFNVYLHSE
jgi:FtsP/CotA-like multicopper oxidase with cupredoxin domain